MDLLLATLAGLASSAALGAFKSATGALDTKIGNAIKPFQPFIVTGLSMALPSLANLLHLTAVPDATVLASAPLGGLIGVVAREVSNRITSQRLPSGVKKSVYEDEISDARIMAAIRAGTLANFITNVMQAPAATPWGTAYSPEAIAWARAQLGAK